MRKPRVFLSIVLILLLINAVFFALWYGFGLQHIVKSIIEKEVGHAIGGKLAIKTLSIGDRQILLKSIVFEESDETYAFKVEEIRVHYNLLKLLYHRFYLAKAISLIEVTKPHFEYHYIPSEEPSPHKTKIKMPDLTPYFAALKIYGGSVYATIRIDLSDSPEDSLYISETIQNIDISLVNDSKSSIFLNAKLGLEGIISAKAVFNAGAIESLDAEIKRYNPTNIEYSMLQGFSSEISTIISITQMDVDEPLKVNYSALIWNTYASYDVHRVAIPFVGLKGNLDDINVDLPELRINDSRLSGAIEISKLSGNPEIDADIRVSDIDLSIFEQSLKGLVSGSITANGSLKDPKATALLRSREISYDQFVLNDVNVNAQYSEKAIDLSLFEANWGKQSIRIHGTMDTYMMEAVGKLSISSTASHGDSLKIDADIDFDVGLYSSYPTVDMKINHLDAMYHEYSTGVLIGSAKLAPLEFNGELHNLLAEVNLTSSYGLTIEAIGDILDETGSISLSFMDLAPHRFVSNNVLSHYKPTIGGEISCFVKNRNITAKTDMHIVIESDLSIDTEFILLASADINDLSGSVYFNSKRALFNGEEIHLNFYATYAENYLNLAQLMLNDRLLLSGKLNSNDIYDFSCDLLLRNVDSEYINRYLAFTDIVLPDFENVNVNAQYNKNSKQELSCTIDATNMHIDPLNALNLDLSLNGDINRIDILGHIKDMRNSLVDIHGTACISPTLNVDVFAVTNQLALDSIISNLPLILNFDSLINFKYEDILNDNKGFTLSADVSSSKVVFQEYTIDSLNVSVIQNQDSFEIKSLSVTSDGLLNLRASGGLDYNFITNTFYEGERELSIDLSFQLFKWLKNNFDYIEDARGKSRINCSIGVSEDNFFVNDGELAITEGMIKLKDQIEPITDFRFTGVFDHNRFQINEASCSMGLGKLYISNYFESEPSDHFLVGSLDLGIIKIHTNSNGILVNIPEFTPPRTLSKVVIKGRNSPELVVKGPFDNMKILGDAIVSNTNVVYPPNTDNLLKMIYTVREAATSRPSSDPTPLPFILDAMITIQDNARYITYPVNLEVSPNSFLHLLYDGRSFSVNDASFTSERGSIDFFGTVFQVDYINVSIIDAQDLMNIRGTFYKRAVDGTMITLNVTTPHDPDKDLLNRLEFSLVSDNPEDRTISHILSRLRYNQPVEELSADQRQSLLQDDAINLVSQNLNSSILTPFLYPLENRIRRYMRLDNFSIRAGFIQNLVNEYVNDSSQFTNYTNSKQSDNDLLQLSSSILLNNLSVSMSKYLGRKFFIDYEFSLQEATDLSQRTKLLVTHDTSLRLLLPRRFRIAYTFKYEPTDSNMTHEVMLQRSFSF